VIEAAMTRILGIDYGSERIGLALSDPMGIIASPLDAITNDTHALERLHAVIAKESVTTLVVGMPLTLKGEMGSKAQEVEEFISLLESALGLRVIRWDERYTTTIARRSMIDLGTKKKTRRTDRGRVDAMAAAVLLQSYLDHDKRPTCC